MSAIRFLVCRHAAKAAASSAAMILGQGRVGVGRSMPSITNSIMNGLIPARDPLPARPFSDQATSWLITTVKKEIDFETRGPDEPNSEILARGTPAGWTLVENEVPGDTLMVLKKQAGDTQLEIEWMVNDQPSTTEPEMNEEDEEDEEMEQSALVNFTMKVVKADQQLVVELLTPGGSAHIQHVTLAPKGGFPGDSDSMYHGPVFDELDEELQAGLTDYLRDVGLTPDVIDFVFAKVYSKERTEYVAWLQRLEKFLEQ